MLGNLDAASQVAHGLFPCLNRRLTQVEAAGQIEYVREHLGSERRRRYGGERALQAHATDPGHSVEGRLRGKLTVHPCDLQSLSLQAALLRIRRRQWHGTQHGRPHHVLVMPGFGLVDLVDELTAPSSVGSFGGAQCIEEPRFGRLLNVRWRFAQAADLDAQRVRRDVEHVER